MTFTFPSTELTDMKPATDYSIWKWFSGNTSTATTQIPQTGIVPSNGVPAINTGGSNVTYDASMLGGLFKVNTAVPGDIVKGLGTTAIISGLALAYVLLK